MSGASSPAAARVEPTTENCRFCWMCRHVCPVGQVTRLETHTPHAWALAIESVKRGQLAWTPEAAGVLYACADCGLCRAHCVTDQPLPDAIAAARADLVARGLAPALVSDLRERFERYANPYVPEPPPDRPVKAEVVLLVGDAAQHLRPASVDAARRLLEAAGVAAAPIGAGRSSGWLASSLGLSATGRMLASTLVEQVEAAGAREVLVLAPADAWAIEHVYGARLGVTWPRAVAVREVTSVLADALDQGRLQLTAGDEEAPYAYHDPCHAPRIGRDGQAPRRLLAAALGDAGAHELFWRRERAHPCGAIGGLEFVHPEVAAALAAARHADASAAGAVRLITEDPACTHQLAHHAGLPVVNLYELLAARL